MLHSILILENGQWPKEWPNRKSIHDGIAVEDTVIENISVFHSGSRRKKNRLIIVRKEYRDKQLVQCSKKHKN